MNTTILREGDVLTVRDPRLSSPQHLTVATLRAMAASDPSITGDVAAVIRAGRPPALLLNVGRPGSEAATSMAPGEIIVVHDGEAAHPVRLYRKDSGTGYELRQHGPGGAL